MTCGGMWIVNLGSLGQPPKDRTPETLCAIRASSFGSMNQTLASHLQLRRDERPELKTIYACSRRS
jgi:hypothetical protein